MLTATCTHCKLLRIIVTMLLSYLCYMLADSYIIMGTILVEKVPIRELQVLIQVFHLFSVAIVEQRVNTLYL